jgi:hypothetical protein
MMSLTRTGDLSSNRCSSILGTLRRTARLAAVAQGMGGEGVAATADPAWQPWGRREASEP